MNPIKPNELGEWKMWPLANRFLFVHYLFLVYSIKRDLTSDTKDETDHSNVMTTKISPKKVEGVGETTREGMPLAMRSVRILQS